MSIDLQKLNESVRTDPLGFIAKCDAVYDQRVHSAAVKIKENLSRSPIILLAGPSSSAKTTTAGRIRHMLRGMGVRCHMVSLDDYYRTRTDNNYPLTADGKPDLEKMHLITFDPVHAAYLTLGHRLGQAFRDGHTLATK